MNKIDRDNPRTFLSTGWSDQPVSNSLIREDPGFEVSSYDKLVSSVAQVAFYNKDHVLLFRGQPIEHVTNADDISRTVLKPSLFRAILGEPLKLALPQRFARLKRAESLLVESWKKDELAGLEDIVRHRILRWSILQHYEVCKTPLLDATHSLRVAVSFAAAGTNRRKAVLYVLAVPQLSGAVTASAEAGLQIVRLSGICPPSARRPHFQEGYLLGEYPEIDTVEQKRNYEAFENDFCRRLIAKFRLDLSGFRDDKIFPLLPDRALYPDKYAKDPLEMVINRTKERLGAWKMDLSSHSS